MPSERFRPIGDNFIVQGQTVPMCVLLTLAVRPDAEAVLWSDIDTLRCILPEGG